MFASLLPLFAQSPDETDAASTVQKLFNANGGA